MPLTDETIKNIARMRKIESIRAYTEAALQNPDLTHQDKIKILSINQNNRLNIIMRIQKHTLDHLFIKNPRRFFTNAFHYDWWVFPMHVPVEWNWPQRNYDASINLNEAKTLLTDPSFVDTYLHCVSLYMDALETHGWNQYPVRYARMLQSLALFLEAARNMEDMFSVHERLHAVGRRAVHYATVNVMPHDPDYALLTEGFSNVCHALRQFDLLSANVAASCV